MIIHSIVIAVLVAFLSTFVFQALKPTQDANVALDEKKQMLNSLNIRDLNNEDTVAKYQETVLTNETIDEQGDVLERGERSGEDDGFKLNSANFKNGKLALFVCKVNGQTKYVISVHGMGLRGAISDYVAINTDKPTVFGTYFDHDSKATGLGAETKDSCAWQNQFQGKELFAQDPHQIALAVSRKVKDPSTRVDGVTGATLTSSGVTEMLQTCSGAYMNFLKAH